MPALESQVFMLILGLFFLAAGTAGITGRWKRWYWSSRRMVFIYFPVAILFFMVAGGQSVSDPAISNGLRVAEFIVMGIGIWWLARPPKFMIPAWIQKIEEQPRSVYEAMRAAVKKGEPWHERVNNPEALEQWIKSIQKNAPKKSKGSPKR